MITEAYAVHDKAVGAFMPVFFVRSRGEALRSFMAACQNPEHQFARNAGDYTLYAIGGFDDVQGSFIADANGPERVLSALEVIDRDKEKGA